MEYRGSNDERGRADEIYAAYVEAMRQFVRWPSTTAGMFGCS